MAKSASTKEYTTFVKGLITEASPLTFPENASLDEDNFELLRNGSRRRRLGIDYESGYAFKDTGLSSTLFSSVAVSSSLWESVNRKGDLNILVIQVGLKLYFYNADDNNISASPLNGGAAFNLYGDSSVIADTTSIFGKLVVTNGQKGFYVLTYDESTDTISAEGRILLVRDIWGVYESSPVNSRSGTLSGTHEYNLINQGWSQTYDFFFDLYYKVFKNLYGGKYPSNADIVHLGKIPGTFNEWNTTLITRSFLGNTPAPKGFSVIDAFRRSASRNAIFTGKSMVEYSTSLSGDPFAFTKYDNGAKVYDSGKRINSSSGLPSDSSTGGLTTTAAFAGRLWLASESASTTSGDKNSPDIGAHVFFSQVIDSEIKFGRCYQEGDPTSENDFDPVDSDGGAVRIPDISRIYKLISVGRSLVVLSENGVWEISGGESNFSATNIEVSKVSTVGPISKGSIINIEGNVIFWGEAGIYALSPDEVTGRLTAKNITEDTIQTLYNSISDIDKSNCVAVFDPPSRKVRWLYNDNSLYSNDTFKNRYNRELIYDLVLQAFYTNTIGELASNSPYLAGYILAPTFNIQSTTEDVTVGGVTVTVSGVDVTINVKTRTANTSRQKFLIIKPGTTYKFTIGNYSNTSFLDWETDDGTGVDSPAYLITGYELGGDTQRNKQAPYITCHFLRTESGFTTGAGGGLEPLTPSSCYLQARWDFSDSSASGKFSSEQQVYRYKRIYIPTAPSSVFDYGQEVITTKSKIRGRGRALSLKFRTEAGKDMHIYGWGISFTGGTNV